MAALDLITRTTDHRASEIDLDWRVPTILVHTYG
jgi:hypothetical protein